MTIISIIAVHGVAIIGNGEQQNGAAVLEADIPHAKAATEDESDTTEDEAESDRNCKVRDNGTCIMLR